MIAHVVLFRPKADLTPPAREALVQAFAAAINQIPSIRRLRVGKRVTHGRPYEDLMEVDYQYAAILEFDDLQGLKGYLEHAAHVQLAASFFAASGTTLIYDFELGEGAAALTGLSD
jgi:stress responsive alpha/beta barrel protein